MPRKRKPATPATPAPTAEPTRYPQTGGRYRYDPATDTLTPADEIGPDDSAEQSPETTS